MIEVFQVMHNPEVLPKFKYCPKSITRGNK